MVALTNNNQQNYTSNLSVEALQDVGGTLQDLNAMNQTLTQNLASQASRLSPSDIANYEAALSANVNTQNKAMAAAASQGMNLGNNLRQASNNLVNQIMITDILQDEVNNSERAYEALKQNNAIQDLKLYCNKIGNAGAIAIGEGLKQNYSIYNIK